MVLKATLVFIFGPNLRTRILASIYQQYIATTQYSPELKNLDWGGSIIAKLNHTPPHHHWITFLNEIECIHLCEGLSIYDILHFVLKTDCLFAAFCMFLLIVNVDNLILKYIFHIILY